MMKRLLGLLMMLGVLVGMSGCVEEIKVWTTTWDDGSVKEEYQYYNHPEKGTRMKDGWYTSYYENGDYNEIGKYKEDVKDGEWSYFTEDGKETKGIYKDGNEWSGEFVVYYESGEVWWEGNYVGGEKEGKMVSYHESGKVGLVGNYVDGKEEGKWVWYDEEGNITLEVCHEMGESVSCP